MGQLISTIESKCNLSYTCIRVCPAKAIKIEENHSHVIASRCVGCGRCFTMCAQGAIEFRSEIHMVRDFLKSHSHPLIVICDPTIAAEFIDITDSRKFVAMLRLLGFDRVVDMSFGVDLIGIKYRSLLENFQGKFYISANCPPVVSLVEKYHPDIVENLAPIVPPYIAMAKVARKKYGHQSNVIYITACIAAKDDVHHFTHSDGRIDSVLTFRELRELFKEYNVSETNVEYSEFDPPLARKGGLYPVSRGFVQSADIDQDLLNSHLIITEGFTNTIQALSQFESNTRLSHHLDTFYCKGCVMGPGTSDGGKKFIRRSSVVDWINKRMKDFNVQDWKESIEIYSTLDFSRSFKPHDKRLPIPSDSLVDKVLQDMGKANKEDQTGCGSCGYSSCRDFAVAYTQGLTNFEMCYTYSNKKLQSTIEKLNNSNLELKETKEALKESEARARLEGQLAREASETTSAMLQKIRAGVVIVNEDLRIMESNMSFVNMIGDEAREINEVIPGLKGAELKLLVPFHRLFSTVLQTGEDLLGRDTSLGDSILNVSVFTIKKHQVVGGIIRDLTAPEVRKAEIIERSKAVIQDNLETVQQIAFLLGESAAKTEKILNSIIQTQKMGHNDEEQ